jgi:Icc protein
MVLGNHDTFSTASQYYNNGLTEGRNEMMYSFEEIHFRCLVLDSSTNLVSTDQLVWLEQQLNTPKNVLIFIHHPVLEINTPLDKIGAALKERDKLKKVLVDSKTDTTIFCGHYHMADEAIEENIKQITTIAASYQIIKESTKIDTDQYTFGYRLIQIDGDLLKTDAILLK